MIKLRLSDDHADRAGFVRGKADSLGDRLSTMAGQTVKVEIAIPEASGGKTRPKRGVTQDDLDEAMKMPLTRQVAHLFNATPVNVRDQTTPNNPTSND